MSKKVLIIIIAAFVMLIGMMGAGFYVIMKQMNNAVAQVQRQNNEETVTEEETPPETEEATIGPMYKLDTMIVNLADQGGKRYLRITMEFELKPLEQHEVTEVVEELDKRLPQLRDAILMILPTKQYADISSTAGKIALRDEIMAKLNSYLKKGQITTIYFTEFVVQ